MDQEYDSGLTGLVLAGKAVVADNPNNRGEFDATDLTFPAVGPGSRQVQAAILYKFVTNLNASIPIAYIDSGGFPFTANGGDIDVTWNIEGIAQTT